MLRVTFLLLFNVEFPGASVPQEVVGLLFGFLKLQKLLLLDSLSFLDVRVVLKGVRESLTALEMPITAIEQIILISFETSTLKALSTFCRCRLLP